jgi:hypothetical protein
MAPTAPTSGRLDERDRQEDATRRRDPERNRSHRFNIGCSGIIPERWPSPQYFSQNRRYGLWMTENLGQTWPLRAAEPSSSPVGRRLRVRYSFWGPSREMEQTFVLASGEQRIKTGLIGVGGLGILPHAGIVMLTDQRLCLLVHHSFRSDQGFELPRGSVLEAQRMGLPTLRFVRLSYRTSLGLAHLDLTADTKQSPATIRMGQPVKAKRLVEAMHKAWGPQAPTLDIL